MICPRCNTYYVSGMLLCPDCNIELLSDEECDELDETIRDMLAQWVLVYTTNTMMEAVTLKAYLEGADIPVHIHSQIDTTRQFTVGALAIVKIYVRSSDFDEASAIVRDMERRNREE